mgnify:CR=1 FL=1
MKLEMVLKDETVVELIEASYPQHYVLSCGSRTAFTKVWGKMTDENVSEIHIKEDDEEKAVIAGSQLVGTQTVNFPNNVMIGHRSEERRVGKECRSRSLLQWRRCLRPRRIPARRRGRGTL